MMLQTLLTTAEKRMETPDETAALQARVADLSRSAPADRLTIAEASQKYGIRKDTLHRACWEHRLPGERSGKFWFVRAADIREYLIGRFEQT